MNPQGEETTQKDGSTLVDQKQKRGRANETIAVLEIIIYFADHGPLGNHDSSLQACVRMSRADPTRNVIHKARRFWQENMSNLRRMALPENRSLNSSLIQKTLVDCDIEPI